MNQDLNNNQNNNFSNNNQTPNFNNQPVQPQASSNMYQQPVNQWYDKDLYNKQPQQPIEQSVQQQVQQPVYQEPVQPQQPIKTKKNKTGLIIGIAVAVVVVILATVTIILLSKNKPLNNNLEESNNITESNEYKKEDVIYDVYNMTDSNDSITKLTFTYNGKTLTYPFTLKEIESLGILVDVDDKNKQVGANSGLGNIAVYTGVYNEQNEIILNVFNETNSSLPASDCIVNYVNNINPKVSINNITPQTSNYKDILEKFGRDNEKRKNTFYNENLRQENEGEIQKTLSYSSQNAQFLWCYLDISLDMDYDNNKLIDKVYRIIYKQGR